MELPPSCSSDLRHVLHQMLGGRKASSLAALRPDVLARSLMNGLKVTRPPRDRAAPNTSL